MKRAFVLLLAASCASGPVAPAPAPTETSAAAKVVVPAAPLPADLVGKWRASGSTPPDPQGRTMGWMAEYDFHADGTFLMSGYPPISVTGRVQVLGREGSRVHLLLTQRKMSGDDWPDLDRWGTLSADGKSLEFDGKSFQR